MATKLLVCAEQTVSTLNEGRNPNQPLLEDDSESESSGSEQPVGTTSIEVSHIKERIELSHVELLKVAESALEEATRKVRDIEKEIDAHKSVIYFINHSLNSSLELREKSKDRIQRMKEVIGPLRRMPDELWLQIFEERVTDDEEIYEKNMRAGKIPFTVLKLTWICRHWRWIITEHPPLWRYIAIPRALSTTESQWERIEYFRQRVKKMPPIVYTVRHSRGLERSGFYLRDLLRRFSSFKSLELFVSRRFENVDYLLASARPRMEELILRGFPKEGDPVIHCAIRHKAFHHVKTLSCFHVQPIIREDFGEEEAELTSLNFCQADIEQFATITFLDDLTSITTVTIDMIAPFTIDGDPINSATTLNHITTLSANLVVLTTLFNGNVILPNLQSVTVRQEPTMSMYDTKAHWASFLSHHKRKETISTLGILGLPFIESPEEGTKSWGPFIGQAASVTHLVLEGPAVVPVLENLVATKSIPSKLVKLTISNDDSVTEEHVVSFLRAFYSEKREPLSLQILDSVSLSESTRQRLAHVHESFTNEEDEREGEQSAPI
jgi:hypothetical protein